eukprot:6948693-Pyramimonas_sp.AAC.1
MVTQEEKREAESASRKWLKAAGLPKNRWITAMCGIACCLSRRRCGRRLACLLSAKSLASKECVQDQLSQSQDCCELDARPFGWWPPLP